jgi:hypothetical protein
VSCGFKWGFGWDPFDVGLQGGVEDR